MGKLISLNNIFKIYGENNHEVRALNGVDLTINSGEMTSIVGTSGSGKSTLMNILGCLDLPTSGEYHLDNVDILSCHDAELSHIRNKKIGFIFQGFNLISGLTAIENVELPLIYRGVHKAERRKLAIKALEKVSLLDRINHRPSQMSGGQQQRVAVARALAAEPPIILADEPTGNLDSKSGSEVIEMLRMLNERGKTIIIITHDMEIAKQTARVISISDGKIVNDVKN